MKENPWVSGRNINPFLTSADGFMTAMDTDTPSPILNYNFYFIQLLSLSHTHKYIPTLTQPLTHTHTHTPKFINRYDTDSPFQFVKYKNKWYQVSKTNK